MKALIPILLLGFVGGCTTFEIPDTLGDPANAQNYGYHPLDPLPVTLSLDTWDDNESLMKIFPDETMRLAVGTVSHSGEIAYGPAKLGVKGMNYIVVLDYIKFGTQSFGVTLSPPDGRSTRTATLTRGPSADVVVPVYIGVGLRLTASFVVTEGSVDLGSLLALGVAAKANRVSGTLVVQTLGLSGREISPLVPMPSEINESTIQNAILALGSIRAKMYEKESVVTPRVVGVYNNLGGGAATINGFISSLLEQPIVYPRVPDRTTPTDSPGALDN